MIAAPQWWGCQIASGPNFRGGENASSPCKPKISRFQCNYWDSYLGQITYLARTLSLNGKEGKGRCSADLLFLIALLSLGQCIKRALLVSPISKLQQRPLRLLFMSLRMYSQAATRRGPHSGFWIHSEGNEKQTHYLSSHVYQWQSLSDHCLDYE